MDKHTFVVIAPEEQADALYQAFEKSAAGCQVVEHTVEGLNGPIEPDEWPEDGPKVMVIGVWEMWTQPYSWLDYVDHSFVVEIVLDDQPMRMVCWKIDEDTTCPENSWDIPKGVGPFLGCEEEEAARWLKQLGDQILDEFGTSPLPNQGVITKAEIISPAVPAPSL